MLTLSILTESRHATRRTADVSAANYYDSDKTEAGRAAQSKIALKVFSFFEVMYRTKCHGEIRVCSKHYVFLKTNLFVSDLL